MNPMATRKATFSPPPQAQQPPTPPSLFHSKSPSAIEITAANQREAKKELTEKVTEGCRWISTGFINDDRYDPDRGYFISYRVIEQDNKPVQSDFKDVDIVLWNTVVNNSDTKGKDKKLFFYIDSKGDMQEGYCLAQWDSRRLKKYFDTNLSGDCGLPSNPVLKARQTPRLEVGDWVVIQGKTLRLIKASDTLAIINLKQQTNTTNDGPVTTENFFKDSYVRLAGAYIRRLERMFSLKEAFDTFFNTEPIRKVVEVRLATGPNQHRECGRYNSYHKVTLKNTVLTVDNLRLLRKALGININPAQLNANSTIENTIPFKKVLEILTFYNKDYNSPHPNIPILVCFQISHIREVKFLLNAEARNLNQLIISREASDGIYTGNAYPFWVGYPTSSPNAALANLVLNQPLSQSKTQISDLAEIKKMQNLIEFLACTQIVEAHATPGQLQKSRVPGMGKQARSIIRKAEVTNKPLSDFFVAKNLDNATVFYPMAATKGTPNGRNAVNTLNRVNTQMTGGDQHRTVTTPIGRKTDNNAPDYDMSEDSDVEFS